MSYPLTASVTLSGLAPSTMYEIYVRGNCGVTGYSEWSFASTFSTECGTIAALPYYENFNGWSHGSSPLCWDKGEEQFPWVTRYDDRFNNGCAYAFDFMFSPTAVRYVILPEIEAVSINKFLTADDATKLVSKVDLVIDALDNVESRLILEDVCEQSNVPLVHGAVQGWQKEAYPDDGYGNARLGRHGNTAFLQGGICR